MASYATIPADVDVESETALLHKPETKKSFKPLIAGAALAAFALGVLAGTVVQSTGAVKGPSLAAASNPKAGIHMPGLPDFPDFPDFPDPKFPDFPFPDDPFDCDGDCDDNPFDNDPFFNDDPAPAPAPAPKPPAPAPAPAPKPPAPLPTDICEAGTFCNIDCAEKYANFDAAKGCANAAKGYCCEDTKPANYPFTPAA